jgi:hypothetical protein
LLPPESGSRRDDDEARSEETRHVRSESHPCRPPSARRRVAWAAEARPAPIRPLLDALAFTAGRANWGAGFRCGLFQVGADDFARISAAMGAAT